MIVFRGRRGCRDQFDGTEQPTTPLQSAFWRDLGEGLDAVQHAVAFVEPLGADQGLVVVSFAAINERAGGADAVASAVSRSTAPTSRRCDAVDISLTPTPGWRKAYAPGSRIIAWAGTGVTIAVDRIAARPRSVNSVIERLHLVLVAHKRL